ncbi:hypothetical protein MCUN1_003156 [Malassezia cuniculi]|uniref:Phosphoglycerate mutase family protein n=1 Tax=Malassezia cuniculi TaxID=948313 RepID=A0AAF0F105_9BASI|nr:hypothetical protein MCUN1_003156 [Malassezia cuniculi]
MCAESDQNATQDSTILDAPLTALGKQQAARVPALTAALQQSVDVILSSPLRRTLQTTAAAYAPAISRLGGHKSVVVLPQLQECNAVPCDTGSSRAELESDSEFAIFDLSALTDDWTSKAGFYAADDASLNARAQWIRQHLRERPENEIALVAHGDILRRMIGDLDYPWNNAEIRAFSFDPAAVETDECPLVAVQDIEAGGWEPSSDQSAGVHATNSNLARMEERVRQMQASVSSQVSELEELDRRLADAERRHSELESKTA